MNKYTHKIEISNWLVKQETLVTLPHKSKCNLTNETNKAIEIELPNIGKIWLPKSQTAIQKLPQTKQNKLKQPKQTKKPLETETINDNDKIKSQDILSLAGEFIQ